MDFSLDSGIDLKWGDTTARIDPGGIVIAHMGCFLLGKLAKENAIPEELALEWKAFGWLSTKDATGKLGACLRDAIIEAELEGAVLWDTMRTGSSVWRPGDCLLKAADKARSLHDAEQNLQIEYARDDEFCPPRQLLDAFRLEHDPTAGPLDGPPMPFGRYAGFYAAHLREERRAERAAAQAVLCLARGLLPIFYCVDQYIPGYADPGEQVTAKPYFDREWSPHFREQGCHRVVLTEEIVRVFHALGAPVAVLELDQSRNRVHRREYPVPRTARDEKAEISRIAAEMLGGTNAAIAIDSGTTVARVTEEMTRESNDD